MALQKNKGYGKNVKALDGHVVLVFGQKTRRGDVVEAVGFEVICTYVFALSKATDADVIVLIQDIVIDGQVYWNFHILVKLLEVDYSLIVPYVDTGEGDVLVHTNRTTPTKKIVKGLRGSR